MAVEEKSYGDITICYFNAKKIFLSEPKGHTRGGGACLITLGYETLNFDSKSLVLLNI
jgi:hypothetical protein